MIKIMWKKEYIALLLQLRTLQKELKCEKAMSKRYKIEFEKFVNAEITKQVIKKGRK